MLRPAGHFGRPQHGAADRRSGKSPGTAGSVKDAGDGKWQEDGGCERLCRETAYVSQGEIVDEETAIVRWVT